MEHLDISLVLMIAFQRFFVELPVTRNEIQKNPTESIELLLRHLLLKNIIKQGEYEDWIFECDFGAMTIQDIVETDERAYKRILQLIEDLNKLVIV